MKVIIKTWANRIRECELTTAIESVCTDNMSTSQGAIEDLQADLQRTREFIGRLVERLVEKNVLSMEDVRLITFEDIKTVEEAIKEGLIDG